ncbi:MAG: multiheme c-type cytochrome [Isosphaerales bacterium]
MTASSRARARLWVLGGVVLLFSTGGGTLLWLSGRLPFQEQSHGGFPVASIRSADEPEARRSRALASIREARFDEAFEFFQGLDERQWEAGDCFTLGSALLKRDRMVLGWAALEAARRIDPKHESTVQALDGLQNKQALATGPERVKHQETASRVELLRSVPGGPQLGMLVLGLARYANDPDQEDEFLDRIWVRDGALLRGVKSTHAAIKLGARLLLETGRASEARALLEFLVPAPKGDSESTSASAAVSHDREAAWLLSRAALQLDQDETADAMLALAGDYGKGATALPEPAPFVGSKRCGACHRTIYNQQQRTSRHASTLRLGSGLKDVPLPAHPVPDPVIPSISFSFSRRGDDHIELESRVEDRVIRAIVEYALGSGRHGITMLAKDEEGIERELRISYYGEGQTWGETKGVESSPRDLGDQIGIGLGRKTVHHCLHCHTTWFRSVDQGRSGPRGPEAQDHGIGCERCHGPGLNHDKAVSSGFAELAIALTPETPSIQRLKSCTQCHASDGAVEPSDPEFTRVQGTTFLFSRCFTASKDRFGCTICHDPHRPVDTSIPHYEAKCLSCHAATLPRRDPASSPGARAERVPQTARSCPVSPAEKCISCHMPKVEDPSRRSRFTDHHIRIHRGPD